MKLTKRKGFNFFRSYFDVYNELPDKDKVKFIDALLDRQFLNEKPTTLDGMAKFAYISQTNSIDSQVKGFIDKMNKLEPGVNPFFSTPTIGATVGSKNSELTPTVQVQVEGEEKVQVKEKDIEARKLAFKNEIWDEFKSKYPESLLKDFCLYWTEHGKDDKKMRFEKEKSFGRDRRLDTWSNNDKKFNGDPSKNKYGITPNDKLNEIKDYGTFK